jgi:hypothetical protein
VAAQRGEVGPEVGEDLAQAGLRELGAVERAEAALEVVEAVAELVELPRGEPERAVFTTSLAAFSRPTGAKSSTCDDKASSIGQVKSNRGANRFLRRGRSAVRSEWRLLTATNNLLKLHRHQLATARPSAGRPAEPTAASDPTGPSRIAARADALTLLRHLPRTGAASPRSSRSMAAS